jgi:DnaJ-class molecular chaperone
MMDQFGFVFRSGNPNIPPKNKDLHIRCRISLKDSYLGKTMNVSYNLPSGRAENLELNIPPGVESGQNLKVTGYGDDSITNIPRGDLTVTIEVDRDPKFRREEFNLITKLDIDIFDAMLGCTKKILNIDDKEIEVTIRPGTQHGQKYSCKGLGFRNIRFTNTIGDLLVEVNVKTLTTNNPIIINQIQQLASLMRQETN